MSSPDKCPKCQAPVVPPYVWKYGCGSTLNGTVSELCETRSQLAELRKELEKSKADAESWHQQAQQRLDDANEFGRKWEKAESRVRELEGLKITGTHYFSDFVGVAVTLPMGSTPTIGRTLGEAMPQQKGGQS